MAQERYLGTLQAMAIVEQEQIEKGEVPSWRLPWLLFPAGPIRDRAYYRAFEGRERVQA